MAFSRRDFLKRSCCTAAAGFAAASFNRFGMVNALAQSSQDYKALVCVFLFGGNDSNNMVVPLSSSRIQLVPAGPLGAGPAAGESAADRAAQRGFVWLPSQIPRDAGPVQSEAPGGTGQRRHAGSSHHPHSNSAETRPRSREICSRTKTSRRRCRPQPSLTATGETGWAGRTADKIQSIYGSELPHDHFAGGTNIFCEGLSARAIQSSGDPTRLLSGFGSFGGIPEPDVSIAEPADIRHRRVLDPGSQQHYDQCLAGQQGAGGCAGGAVQPWPRSFPTAASPTSSNRWRRLSRCARRWDCSGRSSSFRSEASTPTAIN